MLPPEPNLASLEAAGAVVEQQGAAHTLALGFFTSSRFIPRQASNETGLAGHHTLSDGRPLDVVLGGYHLAGRLMEPRIEQTVRDLADRVSPRIVAPGHCTGWRAKTALANEFAPGGYAPNVVGTVFRLGEG